MSKSIEQAVVSGDFLEFYWQTRRHSPDQVCSIRSATEPAARTAFMTGLINEQYRLRTQFEAVHKALGADSNFQNSKRRYIMSVRIGAEG
jgi:hypothetical protein